MTAPVEGQGWEGTNHLKANLDAVYCCLTEVAAVVLTENNSVINKTMPAKCKLNFFLLIDDICEKKVYTWSQT